MRYIGLGLVLAAVMLPGAASAQSVFDGQWRIDLGKVQLPTRAWVVELGKDSYRCASCTKPWSVAADGGFHAVAGQNYFDEAAVKRIDPMTVELQYRKGGRLVETDRITVSADRRTLTSTDTDHATASGQPAVYRSTARRTKAGARGSHALAGSWQTTSFDKGSENTMTVTMRLNGERLSFADGTGQHYIATLGGPAVKVEGDIAGRTMAVKRLAPNKLQFDSAVGGQADSRNVVTVAPDGKRLDAEVTNLKLKTTTRFVAYKQ